MSVAEFRDFLHPGQWSERLPKGMGGTPVNLLCKELLRRGQRLVLFSCDPSVENEVVLTGDNLRICIGPLGTRPARNFFKTARSYLRHAILRERPDIVHAQWTYEYAMAVQQLDIPQVVTAHDAPLRCLWHSLIPFRAAKTAMAYSVMMRARKIVSVSPYVAEHIRRYAFYRRPEQIIPNGMPAEAFIGDVAPGVKTGAITFATVLVGWGAYKNGQAAIKAFARVRTKHPEARLLMFGAGHGGGDPAASWARERTLAAGIEFVGALPYDLLMKRLAKEVDVLVHPSLVESQGMALIEAMARGIPVIGGHRSGGVPWTLDNGRAGRLVDVRSPDAIAAAMHELAMDAELRRSLAIAALDHARAAFHVEKVADAWQSVYDDLAAQR
ncbi:hypothetical protein N800_04465 [Lysobacter daejeonensis GH1-9]|uniref:Glycosyl transferase family 1 n=2 Tax=Aerolutibacter TaxID=3382701 RepID=A0A0A0EUY8_9GAMM|nr:hypothetical protein N800_04465 [Lysobacter daejeonensis GH1-9]